MASSSSSIDRIRCARHRPAVILSLVCDIPLRAEALSSLLASGRLAFEWATTAAFTLFERSECSGLLLFELAFITLPLLGIEVAGFRGHGCPGARTRPGGDATRWPLPVVHLPSVWVRVVASVAVALAAKATHVARVRLARTTASLHASGGTAVGSAARRSVATAAAATPTHHATYHATQTAQAA